MLVILNFFKAMSLMELHETTGNNYADSKH